MDIGVGLRLPVAAHSLGTLQMVALWTQWRIPMTSYGRTAPGEKSYLFDVAFDFTATQVRGAWAWGHIGSPAL